MRATWVLVLALCLTGAMFLLAAPERLAAQMPYEGVYEQPYGLYTAEQLDNLVAPVALYPDPLLAQILPAATFIDQVEQAAGFVRAYGQNGIDLQPWDISVLAIA